MYLCMFKRLKNAKPRYKVLIGLWLAVELISLPAAAGVAFAMVGKSGPVVAEPIETTQPGTAQFLVTHSVPFDILVSGIKSEVNIIVEDARYDMPAMSSCARLLSTHPRILKTIDAPDGPDASASMLFVTITYDAAETPDISFDEISFVPAALPCQTV